MDVGTDGERHALGMGLALGVVVALVAGGAFLRLRTPSRGDRDRASWFGEGPTGFAFRPGEVATNALGMEFAWVPPGEFVMGSAGDEAQRADNEGPRHQVRLTRGFWLARTEVTEGQWTAVMGTPAAPALAHLGPDIPAMGVTWPEAERFCRSLADRTGGACRLPTEAEWEYACRAGGSEPRYGYPDEVAWHLDNSAGRVRPVGQLQPNAWGLYDMLGNSYEWCADWFGPYAAEPAQDPTGPTTGVDRCARSSSWSFGEERCRSAHRYVAAPGFRGYVGVRPVWSR